MSRRRSLLGLTALCFLALLLFSGSWDGSVLGVESAHAQVIRPTQTFNEMVASITGFLITVMNFLSWFVLSILDHVMDPRFIFDLNPETGADGPLLNMLKVIWQFNRDLANLGFAIGLIVGAIFMIVTADGSKVKEHLPKFVMAVVLVNLSWFIPRVVYDASQVLTYTIYQIPSLLGADNCTLPPRPNEAERRPCELVLRYRFFEQTNRVGANGTVLEDDGTQTTGWTCPLPRIVCIQKVPITSVDTQIRTHTRVFDGLIVNHARMQWLATINLQTNLPAGMPNSELFLRMASIILKMIVVLALHVALLFPLVAMLFAFIIRIPVLWVSMAFMPLIALGYAFPTLREGDYKDLFWEWQNHFLQAVFLPARIAVPFTIGFILINAGAAAPAPREFGNAGPIALLTGVNDMWQLLWMLIALFIIWKYSFQQLAPDKAGIMGNFTEKIKGIGESMGSIATQIPTSIPIAPLGGRSLNQLLHTIDPRQFASDIRFQGLQGGIQGALQRFNSGQQSPTAPTNPGTQQLQKSITNNAVLNTDISQRITNIVNAAPAGRDKAFADLMQHVNRQGGVNGLNERQILQAILAANPGMDANRRQMLEEIIRNRNNGTNAPPA